MDEDKYQKFIKGIPFGRKYHESRSTLSALADKRLEDLKKEIEEKKADQKIEQTVGKPQKKPVKHDDVIKQPPKKIVRDESELSLEEIEFLEGVSKNPDMFVTQIYKTLKLSGYKGDRLKESLLEKELIIQEETRKGKRGRLAKVLVLTEKGTSTLKKLLPAGKGGEFHKQIQFMIKEQAEVFGWKAKIEERIPHSLDSVDVGLKKDDVRVAIEVSATTYPEQELQNIRKCLDAGYDYVISVNSDEKNLLSIKKEARKVFTLRDRERIRFSAPSQVKEYLKGIVSTGIVSEKGIVSDQLKNQKELIGTKEASEFLGIKKQTLYEWVVQRKLPFIKVGRLTKFRKVDLEAWLDKRTKEEKDLI
jgi:excisionase family DNA binding protein